MSETSGPRTLVELLEHRATHSGDSVAYSFDEEPRTFGELWATVQRFAATLIELGVSVGDRVVLVLPNGHDFFTAFYGAQAAGAIAVPIFPGSPPAHVLTRAAICGANHVVAPSDTPSEQLEAWRRVADPLAVVTPRDASDRTVTLPVPTPHDIAFIQYTSGSTGEPKGVQLSHANLLTNARQMIDGWHITAADRFVSWLPCYHDLGLIAMTIVPFVSQAELFLFPASLSDTSVWFDAIERHRATFTAAPDFAYRLCLRQRAGRSSTSPRRPDLSSLRIALNAAEPVRATTIDAFHETFGLENVMTPAYGLAEATVAVCTTPPGSPARIDDRGTVSAGPPFPDVVMQILDDEDAPVANGSVGHLVVTSPALTSGYFENAEATGTLFLGASIRTGDVGYLDDDGWFYPLSRAKDVIIQAGRTVYPQEVEECANSVVGVRYAAAIGVEHHHDLGEQVTVLAEIRPDDMADEAARKACVVAIAAGVHERFGFRPARVHLVAPKTITMTHNGKVRRAELKRRYLDGSLVNRFVYPPSRSS